MKLIILKAIQNKTGYTYNVSDSATHDLEGELVRGCPLASFLCILSIDCQIFPFCFNRIEFWLRGLGLHVRTELDVRL